MWKRCTFPIPLVAFNSHQNSGFLCNINYLRSASLTTYYPPPSLYTTRYTVTPLIRRKPLVSDVVVVLSLLNHLGNPSRNVGPQSKYNVSFWKKGEQADGAIFIQHKRK